MSHRQADRTPTRTAWFSSLAHSGHEALDEAIAAIADAFEFSPGTTLADATEVPMEYVVGFQSERRARLLRWLSAIGG